MSRGRKVARIAAVMVLVLTVVSGVALASVTKLIGNFKTLDISQQLGPRPTKSIGPADGQPINILLMGSDTRVGQGSSFGHKQGTSQRSDTTILIHVAGNRDWATAISIPRDTIVKQPDCLLDNGKTSRGYTGMFNASMERGGPACVVKTVEAVTGVYIDNFVVVNFKGFQQVVDAIGGVDVCLTKSVNDIKSHLVLPKGISTVDGKTALAFVRARHSLGDGSDISRIRRQQDFLASLTRKITSAGVLLNPVKLVGVLNAVSSALTTDPALGSVNGLKAMAFNLQDLRPSGIRFITAHHVPDPTDRNRVIFSADADVLWKSLINDTQWPTPPDNGWDNKPLSVQTNDVHMRVLNATTTAGLAKTKGDLLHKLGYDVTSTGNAPASLGKVTAVWANAKGANAARTIAKALGLTKVNVLKMKSSTNVIVIVGADFKAPVELKIRVKPVSTGYGPATGRAADETDCSPV